MDKADDDSGVAAFNGATGRPEDELCVVNDAVDARELLEEENSHHDAEGFHERALQNFVHLEAFAARRLGCCHRFDPLEFHFHVCSTTQIHQCETIIE